VKNGFDRRQFIAVSAGVMTLTALGQRLRAKAPAVPPAPVARIAVVRDTYFGETLSDPYRWMENDQDPDWLPFLKGQNAHARAVLDALPRRPALLKRVQQLTGDAVATGSLQRAGGLTFFTQRAVGAENFRLLVRKGIAGVDRVLIDPTRVTDRRSNVALDWWSVSPDGRYVVYGLSKNGSEDSTLRVLAVADGSDLREQILNTEQANPQWLDDGSGFFYNQLTSPADTPARYLDSQARFHRLNTDPRNDPVLMKRGTVAGVDYERIQSPAIITFSGSRFALLMLSDVRPEARFFIAPLSDILSGHARWVPIANFEDEVTDIDLHGEELYVLVNKGTPRGRIVRTSAAAPNLADAEVVVPQGSTVIEGFERAHDALYLRLMDGGINRLQRLGSEGVTDIALPLEGTISQVVSDPAEDGVLLSLTGWLTPPAVYSVDIAGRILDTGITPKPAIDVGAYMTTRSSAIAKDGTKIPYTVVHRKDLRLNGRAPTWISAYGSYGESLTPEFVGHALALADAGGIVGYANVRGGGEYGREWHRAGQLENKPNTWRDLIAVCEELIAKRYTSPPYLAIGGRSAGGITVGRAMTERPDLFAAVIDGVGWSNPLRYVVEQNGYGEEPEWGALSDAAGYRTLKSIDSYQAVKNGTPYPAVLLTTGVTDPRVAPFHVAKMTARLQAATTSGKPILLRVDFDAGHGVGSTRSQQDREAADTYAFLLWQLGG
jgi:prolyl oligopeptidase